jgi:hypothetical protein
MKYDHKYEFDKEYPSGRHIGDINKSKDEFEKKFQKVMSSYKSAITPSLSIGSYYMIRFNNFIEMVRVSSITKHCVLFEFVESKNKSWLEIGKDYTLVEELSKDFIRDLKIEQINEN